ncbi:unnamed protein product [Allacma fusca]|uniref:Zinc finger RING-type eukaryotic domain-containing protein n=1 Tax=Allacma fusca TaxID=39272 RepID=A0A8J2PZP3_9HEXA|nr:unnamed protein product [Allacma fusca]
MNVYEPSSYFAVPACSICLKSYTENTPVIKAYTCGHTAHRSCVEETYGNLEHDALVIYHCVKQDCTGTLLLAQNYVEVKFVYADLLLRGSRANYIGQIARLHRQLADMENTNHQLRTTNRNLTEECNDLRSELNLKNRETIPQLRKEIEKLTIELRKNSVIETFTHHRSIPKCDIIAILRKKTGLPEVMVELLNGLIAKNIHLCQDIEDHLKTDEIYVRENFQTSLTRYTCTNGKARGIDTYFLNGVLILGDAASHDLVYRSLDSYNAAQSYWENNELSQYRMTINSFLMNLNIFVKTLPSTVLLSFGEFDLTENQTEDQTLANIKRAIDHLEYRGVQKVYLMPTQCSNRLDLNSLLRRNVRERIRELNNNGSIIYLQTVENIIDQNIPEDNRIFNRKSYIETFSYLAELFQ